MVGQEIEKEVDRLITLMGRDQQRQGHPDLEALEMYIRRAMLERMFTPNATETA